MEREGDREDGGMKGIAGPISSGDGSALVKVGDTTVGGRLSERDL